MAIDAQTVKQAAASGRWPEILATIGGIDAGLLDGRNHPCPKCGGDDRFRFIDPEAGAVLCNQCFREQNGDGLAAVAWLRGCDFPEAIRSVAQYVGLTNGNGNGRPLAWDSTIGPEPSRAAPAGVRAAARLDHRPGAFTPAGKHGPQAANRCHLRLPRRER